MIRSVGKRKSGGRVGHLEFEVGSRSALEDLDSSLCILQQIIRDTPTVSSNQRLLMAADLSMAQKRNLIEYSYGCYSCTS